MRTFRKTAAETLRIDHTWDTHVSSSSWSADSGVTVSGADVRHFDSYALVSGGTLGTTYKVTNTVTLDNSEVIVKPVLVQVVSK